MVGTHSILWHTQVHTAHILSVAARDTLSAHTHTHTTQRHKHTHTHTHERRKHIHTDTQTQSPQTHTDTEAQTDRHTRTRTPGSNLACDGISPESSHTSDLKIGTPVATLPGSWRYRVSTGNGWPGVSILWLGEVERLICNL